MRELPKDDVPMEIMGIIRQTTDTSLIGQEAAGYVPAEHDTLGGNSTTYLIHSCTHL